MLIDIGIYATYILIAICVLAILIFAVSRIISNPGAAKSALLGIAALVVVGIIAYFFSSGADATGIYADLEVSESTSHIVGAGLVGLYIIMALTVLSIIYVELTRLFK